MQATVKFLLIVAMYAAGAHAFSLMSDSGNFNNEIMLRSIMTNVKNMADDITNSIFMRVKIIANYISNMVNNQRIFLESIMDPIFNSAPISSLLGDDKDEANSTMPNLPNIFDGILEKVTNPQHENDINPIVNIAPVSSLLDDNKDKANSTVLGLPNIFNGILKKVANPQHENDINPTIKSAPVSSSLNDDKDKANSTVLGLPNIFNGIFRKIANPRHENDVDHELHTQQLHSNVLSTTETEESSTELADSASSKEESQNAGSGEGKTFQLDESSNSEP